MSRFIVVAPGSSEAAALATDELARVLGVTTVDALAGTTATDAALRPASALPAVVEAVRAAGDEALISPAREASNRAFDHVAWNLNLAAATRAGVVLAFDAEGASAELLAEEIAAARLRAEAAAASVVAVVLTGGAPALEADVPVLTLPLAEDAAATLREAPTPTAVTPLAFQADLIERARADRKRIVLPEPDDDRVLQAAAQVLAAGIAAALYGRTATGTGDRVSVPLQHAGLYTLSTGIISAQYGNAYPKNRREVPNPFNNMYCCADGKWVCVCLPEYDRDFEKICTALEIDPQEFFAIDPEANICAKVNEKSLNQQVVDLLDANFKKYTQAQILETFKANDMPCEPAATPTDIYEDQNCWDNDMLVKIPYPSGDRIMATSPVHFDSMPGAPEYKNYGNMGEQTFDIMKELGYTDEQIAAAVEAGEVRGSTSIFA